MKIIKLLTFILIPFITNAQLKWSTANRLLVQGDTVQVPFRVDGFDSIAAYQFGLEYDYNKIQVIGVSLPNPTPMPMSLLDNKFYVEFGDTIPIPDCITGDFGFCTLGEIRTVWTYPYTATVSNNTLIFTLHLYVLESDTLSNALWFGDNLNPVGYTDTGLPFPLSLKAVPFTFEYYDLPFQILNTNDVDQTIRIYPNPSKGDVVIEGVEEVKVYNSLGQLTHSTTNSNGVIYLTDMSKGVNMVCTNRFTKLIYVDE